MLKVLYWWCKVNDAALFIYYKKAGTDRDDVFDVVNSYYSCL